LASRRLVTAASCSMLLLLCARRGPSGDLKTAPAAPSASREHHPERRQVTVVFSDLVGSTALSAVISAYQKCRDSAPLRRLRREILGDGVLIYFGYPEAHEDDAERAVSAGLQLIAAVTGLKTHAPVQTRVGIATGMVVVGDLIGSGKAQERGIVGETPNSEARALVREIPPLLALGESLGHLGPHARPASRGPYAVVMHFLMKLFFAAP
jgi:class 3 adenylate cyclase